MSKTLTQRITNAAVATAFLLILVGVCGICVEYLRAAPTLGWSLIWGGVTCIALVPTVLMLPVVVDAWGDVVGT